MNSPTKPIWMGRSLGPSYVISVEASQPLGAVTGSQFADASLTRCTADVLCANPDFLRMDQDAVGFVHSFFEEGKPVGVICRGPWTLVEADVLRGRTITSWPSLKTDIRNAGGSWVDEKVVTDGGLVSSRKPDYLPTFCAKIIEEFAEGVHEEQKHCVHSF